MSLSRLATIAALSLCAVPGMAQTLPRAPTLCQNCWPTECGPGNWTAGGRLRVHTRPDDSAVVSFSLQPSDTFVVDSSVVRVTRFGRAVLRQRYEGYTPGDTLIITGYGGEGYYSTWRRGHAHNQRSFWDGDSAPAKLLRPVQQEWWVHVRHGNASGWVVISDSIRTHNLDCP